MGKSTRQRCVRPALASAIALMCVAMMVSSAAAAGGGLFPPNAKPHGYSLAMLSRDTALFTTSGNNMAYYPHTPFQILFADPASTSYSPENGGLVVVGSNRFTAKPSTEYYLPVQNFDDSPPFPAPFPTTRDEAIPYAFGQAQYGAHNFRAVVDGKTTALGASYLVGPVTTQPLLDGGGTHYITLGSFVQPLGPGTHTITISGELSGAAMLATYGLTFLQETYTYTITVHP
jgi:hypothetical protein